MRHTVPIARVRDALDRRAFLGVVTGGLLAAPLVVGAQPVGRVHRIGFLSTVFGANPPTLVGLRTGSATEGLGEGRHVVFEQRFTEGTAGRLSHGTGALSMPPSRRPPGR